MFICLMVLGGSLAAQPFFDMETFPVCMDSAGVKTNLVSINVYSLGTSKVLFQSYVDYEGNKVVPGGSVTVYDALCADVVAEDTLTLTTFESSLVGGYTINAGLYELVTIQNIGYENHDMLVASQAFRLRPGESYIFRSYLNPFTGMITRNPGIVISPGVLNKNNLRITLENK